MWHESLLMEHRQFQCDGLHPSALPEGTHPRKSEEKGWCIMGFFQKEKAAAMPAAAQSQGAADDIRRLEQYLKTLASGKLETPPPQVRDPSLQPLAAALQAFAAQQEQQAHDITLMLNNSLASQIHASIMLNKLFFNLTDIASGVQEVMSVIRTLAESINDIASMSTNIAEQTNSGQTTMNAAGETIMEMSAGNKVVGESIGLMVQRMETLTSSTANIHTLVATVNGISEQTNLLALNASIEAARAGEHGRGFAVVAEEVRKLAVQSKESVEEIRAQLTSIQNEVKNLGGQFDSMDETFTKNSENIEATEQQAGAIRDTFTDISTAMEKLAPFAEQQSASFEEMTASLSQTVDNMHTAKNESKECNTGLFHVLMESSAVRTNFLKNGLSLTSNEILDLAKTDHLIWFARINQMLLGNLQLNSADVINHETCRLGQWYSGEGRTKYGGTPVFENLDAAHARFHQLCAEAIDAYNNHNEYKVRSLLPEIESVSEEVLGALDHLKTT